LNEPIASFEENWLRLTQRWGAATEKWSDPVRWAFEKQTWAPLERQARETLLEMQRLAEVIAQARRQVK
jgi:hypothetical protein